MRAERIDKGEGRIYDTPLTQKEKDIRYVMKFLASGKPLPHGKAYCYGKYGCRLEECRRAMREHQRKYEKQAK